MNGRNGRVSRIICLLVVLDRSPAGMTVTEMRASLLSRGFKISKRTVYRDIEALSAGGLPLFGESGSCDELVQRWKFDHRIKVIRNLEIIS